MKKIIFALCFILVSGYAFSDTPVFIVEASNSYAVGINLENAYQLDARFYYSAIHRFGLTLEAGNVFIKDNNHFHFFVAPMFSIINTKKWRMPIAVGFDLMGGENDYYYGIGGLAAIHYSFTKNIYAGINLGMTYAFDNKYEELMGYRTEQYVGIENDQPAVLTRNIPIVENKSHFGNYIYFKPSIVVGLQF